MEGNPKTGAAHRREVAWQITLPLVLGFLLVAGLAVALGLLGVGDTSRWADISVMWMLLPLLVLALIPLALLIALIYGLVRLLAVLPGWAFQAQKAIAQAAQFVRQVADRLTEPFMRVESTQAALRAGRRTLTAPIRPAKDREQRETLPTEEY